MRTRKERQPRQAGLIFTDELALAILAGDKTETRRPLFRSPKLQAGDSLYGRVTVAVGGDDVVIYRFMGISDEELAKGALHWTPAIHAKAEHAPFVMKLVEVCDEPLHNITEEQAKAEGVTKQFFMDAAAFVQGIPLSECTYRTGFRNVWDQLYGRTVHQWYTNPMVRVYRWEEPLFHESIVKSVRS
jgi:hypothetical protein